MQYLSIQYQYQYNISEFNINFNINTIYLNSIAIQYLLIQYQYQYTISLNSIQYIEAPEPNQMVRFNISKVASSAKTKAIL